MDGRMIGHMDGRTDISIYNVASLLKKKMRTFVLNHQLHLYFIWRIDKDQNKRFFNIFPNAANCKIQFCQFSDKG